jgi:hypothetical protein
MSRKKLMLSVTSIVVMLVFASLYLVVHQTIASVHAVDMMVGHNVKRVTVLL